MQFKKMQTVVITKGVQDRMLEEYNFFDFVMESIEKYRCRDWGNITGDDAKLNDEEPDEALASYEFKGTKIWIKGDGPDLATVLFPDEH